MDIISASIIGLVFIMLIVFAVLASKTWHWVNIVFVVLTFLSGVGASIGLSQAFKLRTDAMKAAQTNEQLADKNRTAAEIAIYGPNDSINYDSKSLRGANQALAMAMAGRGRVWSGGQVSIEGDIHNYKFATARPVNDENPLKLKDILLYVFADAMVGGKPYPQNYVGSVLVTEETPESLKLQPAFVPNAAEWTQPSSTWSLFEKMPLDRHEAFKMGVVAYVDSNPDTATDPYKKLAESITKDEVDMGLFRQVLKVDYLKPELLNLDPASADYEKMIDRYAFDGMSLGKIQNWIDANTGERVLQRFEPAPEEVFVRFKFNKKSNKPYQVDADGSLDTDGPFTPLGQQIEPSLHAGKEVEFGEGETVLVDQLTAEGYQRGPDLIPPFTQVEDVTEIDRIYVRPLRDFPYMLGNLNSQTVSFIEETERVRKNNLVQETALADAEAQLQDRLNTTAGLEQDNANLKNDWDTIQTLATQREEENRNYVATISSLKDQIQQSYQRIQQSARDAERQAFAGN